MEAKHQLVWKRPGLAMEVTGRMNPDPDLLKNFTMDRIFHPLARLYETGKRGVDGLP